MGVFIRVKMGWTPENQTGGPQKRKGACCKWRQQWGAYLCAFYTNKKFFICLVVVFFFFKFN